jgi:hypothetical protein
MDWARREEQWDIASNLMATIVNSQRGKNPLKPDQFNPYKKAIRRRKAKPQSEVSPLLRYL